MPCGHPAWLHARNSTDCCPHPGITNCIECRSDLCSAHIIECEVCDMFVCSDCVFEHYREHERNTRQIGHAA